MQTFLEEVSRYIVDTCREIMGEVCIVTPNRRAGLFLRKHLASLPEAPMWAPGILSIEDFINSISGYSICDNTGLLLEFYSVYKDLEQEKAADIDNFLRWAPALIRDFDDIDNAMSDPSKLYAHLQDIRHLDTWNPDGSPPTPFQQNYLDFIHRLQDYHKALAARLREKKMAWQGLSSREAAIRLSGPGPGFPWKKVFFAGFNALSQAEETIILTLLKKGQAEYLPDSDPYYAADERHEAGTFIRKYRRLPARKSFENSPGHYTGLNKHIRILGIAKNVNQARLAGNLLMHENCLGTDEQTAVVLADEELLIPMLNALPRDLNGLNVTMGYPLSKTNLFAFVDAVFSLYLNASRRPGHPPAFYHKDVSRLMGHSLSRLLAGEGPHGPCPETVARRLPESNRNFLDFDTLCSMSDHPEAFRSAFAFLSADWQQDMGSIFPALTGLTDAFDRNFRNKAATQGRDIVHTPFFADFESLVYFARIFRRMEAFLIQYPFLGSLKTIAGMIRQAASETRLSFSGEPLQGLQVMGMLETRSLDFRNVVLLSANENILPRPRQKNSFIPYEVKKTFGLRLYHEQDAIYSYHFYRLLQRAENIYLIYNTQTEDIGSSEKSRYISQMLHELPSYNPHITISEQIVSLPPAPSGQKPGLVVEKTPDIMERLYGIAEKGFSPSALGLYINCSLQFYFERLARLEEAGAVEETIEATTLGSVVHGVLETIFRPFVGKVLTPGHLRGMHDHLGECLDREFDSQYHGGDLGSGKNLLLYNLARRYIENLLGEEIRLLDHMAASKQLITLVALEEPLTAALVPAPAGSRLQAVNISGKADRIDRIADILRVIDYKTGRVKQGELNFKDWDEPLTRSDKAKAFQLLTYAWLCQKNYPEIPLVEPGIVSMRNPSAGLQTMKFPGGSGSLAPGQMDHFEKALKQIVDQIMDPGRAFVQTPELDNCKWCSFATLCGRY